MRNPEMEQIGLHVFIDIARCEAMRGMGRAWAGVSGTIIDIKRGKTVSGFPYTDVLLRLDENGQELVHQKRCVEVIKELRNLENRLGIQKEDEQSIRLRVPREETHWVNTKLLSIVGSPVIQEEQPEQAPQLTQETLF